MKNRKMLPILFTCFALAATSFQAKTGVIPPPSQNKILSSCNLSAPSSFSGTRTSYTTADLSWSSVSGASAYRLYVWEINGGTNTLVSNTVVAGNSKTLSNLQAGKSYQCGISSICSDGVTSDVIIIIDVIA